MHTPNIIKTLMITTILILWEVTNGNIFGKAQTVTT